MEIEDMSKEQIEEYLQALQDNEHRIVRGDYKEGVLKFRDSQLCVRVKIMRCAPDDILIRIPNAINDNTVKHFFEEKTNLHL